jgi:hypothetical protein
VREWDSWIPEETRELVEVPGIVAVEVHYDIAAEESQLVTFETHFRFTDDDVVAPPHTLRFVGHGELAAFLAEAGFTHVDWYGDWNRSTYTPMSPEIIAVAYWQATPAVRFKSEMRSPIGD